MHDLDQFGHRLRFQLGLLGNRLRFFALSSKAVGREIKDEDQTQNDSRRDHNPVCIRQYLPRLFLGLHRDTFL